ncbi:hypothetical protein ACVWXM_004326 [Bradyrhizobium sp. GM7.3]
MMAALAKAISRATRTNVDVETLKVLVIFSGAGLLLSLVAAMIYGQGGWQRRFVLRSGAPGRRSARKSSASVRANQ